MVKCRQKCLTLESCSKNHALLSKVTGLNLWAKKTQIQYLITKLE